MGLARWGIKAPTVRQCQKDAVKEVYSQYIYRQKTIYGENRSAHVQQIQVGHFCGERSGILFEKTEILNLSKPLTKFFSLYLDQAI